MWWAYKLMISESANKSQLKIIENYYFKIGNKTK